MANAVKGEVAFEAAGAEYKLVFNYNAICELEDAFGVDADELQKAIGKRAKNIRKLLRVGLSKYHPELTEEQVGDIIDDVTVSRAGELIGEAFSRSSVAEAAKGKSRPRMAAKNGTSLAS